MQIAEWLRIMQDRTKAGGKRMRGGGGHVCVGKYWEQWKTLDISYQCSVCVCVCEGYLQ